MKYIAHTLLFFLAVGKLTNLKFQAASFLPESCLSQKIGTNYGRRYFSTVNTAEQYECQTYHSDNYFWGQQKTKDEIVRYCAQMLFPSEDISISKQRIEVISEELPLVVIHNFLTDDMCELIKQAAEQHGDMKRSTIGEEQKQSQTRTSCTTWLREEQCEAPLKFLSNRVGKLSGIPEENFENLQVVQYNGNGEKFDIHTDHLDSFNDLDASGRFGRLATCLVYLNSASDENSELMDEGFDGGSTSFPEYGNVKPRKGSATFWFNTVERTFNKFSEKKYLNVDVRSRHSGEPVLKNEKWVCNKWIHPVPFT